MQVAFFLLDRQVRDYVELEGGGKKVFLNMLKGDKYSPYTWQVRHFKEGQIEETFIRFTPEGKPYGFVKKISESRVIDYKSNKS